MVRIVFILFFAISLISFSGNEKSPYVIILGTAQDGGAPHAACQKVCCFEKWSDSSLHKKVSSIGIVDPESNDVWMIEDFETYDKAIVRVYNRWGALIYTSKSSSYEAWDGTSSSGEAPVGTYYYIIELNDIHGRTYQGDVSILK